MKRIKITYGQLMEVTKDSQCNPFSDDGEKENMNSQVFANIPSTDKDIDYKPTTGNDVTTTPQTGRYIGSRRGNGNSWR